jgi:hypothetical protein
MGRQRSTRPRICPGVVDHENIKWIAVFGPGRRDDPPIVGVRQSRQQRLCEREYAKLGVKFQFAAAAARRPYHGMDMRFVRPGGKLREIRHRKISPRPRDRLLSRTGPQATAQSGGVELLLGHPSKARQQQRARIRIGRLGHLLPAACLHSSPRRDLKLKQCQSLQYHRIPLPGLRTSQDGFRQQIDVSRMNRLRQRRHDLLEGIGHALDHFRRKCRVRKILHRVHASDGAATSKRAGLAPSRGSMQGRGR